jgi:asparagine synthase (glutamine-hydrolysing)
MSEEDLFRFRRKLLQISVKRFQFPPTFYTGNRVLKYYRPEYEDYLNANQENLVSIRESLTEATRKRLMADVPVGVTFWRIIVINVGNYSKNLQGKKHSFSIGLDATTPDVLVAKKSG